jgi:hypothetical protein
LVLFFEFSVSANRSTSWRLSRHEVLAGLKAQALNGYASSSEFSVCRCGSNMWSNRVNSDKLTDPGLLLKRNAWWRLTPDS